MNIIKFQNDDDSQHQSGSYCDQNDELYQRLLHYQDPEFVKPRSEEPPFLFQNDQVSQQMQSIYFIDEQECSQHPLVVPDVINTEVFRDIINRYLSGQQPNDQEIQQLNDEQIKIFEALRDKKGLNDQKLKTQPKRVEEKQKFFFKKAIKYVEKNFYYGTQKQIRKNKKKQRDPLDFYTYYFGDVAKSQNVKIEHFLHPQKKQTSRKQQMENEGLKSLNQTYIKLILQSRSFVQAVKYYLQNNFLEECAQDRRKKTSMFLMKCSQVQQLAVKELASYNQIIPENHVKKKLTDYILGNPKCKIPWSYVEVDDVFQYATSLIEESERTQDKLMQIE